MDYIGIAGANIRYERRKRHLTIEDLSEIVGIAPGFLGLIERGQRGTSIKNLIRVADFFSIPLDKLLTQDLSSNSISFQEKDSESYTKIDTLTTLIRGLNDDEVDFLITTVRALRKVTRSEE